MRDRLPNWLADSAHPLGSPLLGRLTSATVCALGHEVVEMDHPEWDESWVACAVCGARFMPASFIDEDTEVVRV